MTFVAMDLACGEARRKECIRSDTRPTEQRSHRPNPSQPSGRQVFFAQTSLLVGHRSTRDMLPPRASSGRKIPGRERYRIFELGHLASKIENPPSCLGAEPE